MVKVTQGDLDIDFVFCRQLWHGSGTNVIYPERQVAQRCTDPPGNSRKFLRPAWIIRNNHNHVAPRI
jgi:hypothetical protein